MTMLKFMATLLLLGNIAGTASAENITQVINVTGNGQDRVQSTLFSATHLELGNFVDTFYIYSDFDSVTVVDVLINSISAATSGTDANLRFGYVNGERMIYSVPGSTEHLRLLKWVDDVIVIRVEGYIGSVPGLSGPAAATYGGYASFLGDYAQAPAVPEPASALMLCGGLGLLGTLTWRRRRGAGSA